jgi:putative DNA methylase
MYWQQLFSARHLLLLSMLRQKKISPQDDVFFCGCLNFTSRLTRWSVGSKGKPGVAPNGDFAAMVFSNQALNTFFTYAQRSFTELVDTYTISLKNFQLNMGYLVEPAEAISCSEVNDLYITDPPYADAVHYHEITEFFIAWLRKNPPPPFDQWTWDSRRDLAIKGSGDDFRRGMVDAYKAMTDHMPDNGMQCVMFTHQDTGVWSDMVSIFWAAGLQVVGAWYIATETTSELKKGGYVQGTVILMLRKRPAGDRPGFKQRLLPEVKREVDAQIKQMLHLNTETEAKMGAPVFNDSDLQMAGYAAALKVLTGYTSLGGEDVTVFALRPRRKGETTVVDEIVEQAAETANGLLVPEGLDRETWAAIGGIQRFYLRMLDMETTGASKLDNYQNFAKAFPGAGLRGRDGQHQAQCRPSQGYHRVQAPRPHGPHRDWTDPAGGADRCPSGVPRRQGTRGGDGQPERCRAGLFASPAAADRPGGFHRRQGPGSGDPPRRRGHCQPPTQSTVAVVVK